MTPHRIENQREGEEVRKECQQSVAVDAHLRVASLGFRCFTSGFLNLWEEMILSQPAVLGGRLVWLNLGEKINKWLSYFFYSQHA